MGLSIEESYRILELPRGSSPEDIRASYKRLALQWHPDKHNNSTESTKKFQEISAAYKRLTTTEADDFELTPTEMYDLFTHIFFRRSAGFFYRPAHQTRCYDAKAYFDDDDYDDDDDDDDEDDEFDDEVLHGIASRLRSRYERKNDKPAATASRNSGNSAHKLTEEEANKNAAELIEEEERDRKRAEKRRAKKKRNKEKKKQKEKDKNKDKSKKEGQENIQDKNDAPSETEKSKDTESKSTTSSSQSSKTVNSSSAQSTGLKGQSEKTNKKQQSSGKLKTRNEEDEVSSEESPDWDTSSAFFARAAARNPANNTSTNSQASSEAKPTLNPDNVQESQNSKSSSEKQPSSEEIDPVVLRSRQIAVSGNEMANSGNYQAAVDLFTQAIRLDDRDFRFFGNRSYCFDRMGQFEKALQDADMAISLAPDWPKGYFRRGRALAGLKLFLDAESSFAQVLKLDKHCEDALFELARVRIQQLEEMGFPATQSEAAIQSYGTVQAALEALLAGKVKCPTDDEVYLSDGEDEEARPVPTQNNGGCRSVWVGNVNSEEVSERQLLQLFTRCGRVENVRILPKRFCAFINYESPESAARAIQRLQGYEIGGQNLVMRFPNNSGAPTTVPAATTPTGAPPKKRNSPTESNADKLSGPVNGGECYFWRTTGCAFGDKCHYTHIPANKGIDLRKVEAKYGGRLRVN